MPVFLGLFLIAFDLGQSVTIETSFQSRANPVVASMEFFHVPDEEPLSSLRIKLRFQESASLSAVILGRPASGPWSYERPQLIRVGNQVEIHIKAGKSTREGSEKLHIATVSVETLFLPDSADAVLRTDGDAAAYFQAILDTMVFEPNMGIIAEPSLPGAVTGLFHNGMRTFGLMTGEKRMREFHTLTGRRIAVIRP